MYCIFYISNVGNYLGAVKRWGEELTVENRANKEYILNSKKSTAPHLIDPGSDQNPDPLVY